MDSLRFDHDVNVPSDIQIVGFDDIEQAGWRAYALSTVRQNVTEQARVAVELILERLEQPDRPHATRLVGLEKVFRDTTKGPAAQ